MKRRMKLKMKMTPGTRRFTYKSLRRALFPPLPSFSWCLRLWLVLLAVQTSAASHVQHHRLATSSQGHAKEAASAHFVFVTIPTAGPGPGPGIAIGARAGTGKTVGPDHGLVLRQRQATQPAPAPTPATPGRPVQETAPIPADPTILISIISEPSQAQTQAQNPTSANPTSSPSPVNSSTSFSSPSSSSPSSSTISSSSPSPTTPTPAKPTPSIRLSLSTFIPALGGLTLLLLLIVAWLVYGCVTRKPKKRKGLDRDGEELLCGPPYASAFEGESFLHSGDGRDRTQDFERVFGDPDLERGGTGRGRRGLGLHGYEDHHRREEEAHLLGRQQQQQHQQPRRKLNVSRWPSFNSPPTFDPSRGFYVPKRYEGGDGGEQGHEHVRLMAVPPALSHPRTGATKSKSRSRTSHVTTSSRTSRTPQRPGWKSKYSSSSAGTATTNASSSGGPRKHTRTRPPPPTHNPSNTTISTFSTQLYSDPESDEELLQKHSWDKDNDNDNDDGINTKDSSALLDAPWESLRHKSIKRGLLEQVKKGKEREAKWMDSIRSGGAGILASFAGSMSLRGASKSRSGSGGGDEEGVEMFFDDAEDIDGGEEVYETTKGGEGTSARKRRGHVRADSDLFVGPPAAPAVPSSGKAEASTPTRKAIQPLNISKSGSRSPSKSRSSSRTREYSNSGSNSSPTKPGFRRGFSWLKGDTGLDQEEEGFELLPTPFAETRRMQWGQSRSANSSPVKATATAGQRTRTRSRSNTVDSVTGSRTMKTLPATPSRDVLPNGPSQIMSPPLESQMCFTPLGLSIAQMPGASPGAGLPSFGQVVGRGTENGSQSRTEPEADELHTTTKTKLPLPSRRLRFPVTQASPARPAAASAASASASFNLDNEGYVEVGNFAPFRTPTPSPKKLKKGKEAEPGSRSRSRSRSGDGGEGTPVKERESFWTPRKKK